MHFLHWFKVSTCFSGQLVGFLKRLNPTSCSWESKEHVGVVTLVLKGPERYFAFGDPGPDLTTMSLFVKVFWTRGALCGLFRLSGRRRKTKCIPKLYKGFEAKSKGFLGGQQQKSRETWFKYIIAEGKKIGNLAWIWYLCKPDFTKRSETSSRTSFRQPYLFWKLRKKIGFPLSPQKGPKSMYWKNFKGFPLSPQKGPKSRYSGGQNQSNHNSQDFDFGVTT